MIRPTSDNSDRELMLTDAPRFSQCVGLLAGGGRFPFHFADAAHRQGIRVVAVAVRGHADPDIGAAVDKLYWVNLGQLGKTIRSFKREKVESVVMAGKIHKVELYHPWRWIRLIPDMRMLRAFFGRGGADNRDDSLLLMITRELQKDGLRVASALEICPELLANEGTLTNREPTPKERSDIAFAWPIARTLGRLDVGQAIAVKDSGVLAIEAIEGTDQMILRAGTLCPSGDFVVVKVAKPLQDVRFDVPTVGVGTIETMRRAGAKVLAIEAKRSIFIDAQSTIKMADRLGITIVSLTEEEALAGSNFRDPLT